MRFENHFRLSLVLMMSIALHGCAEKKPPAVVQEIATPSVESSSLSKAPSVVEQAATENKRSQPEISAAPTLVKTEPATPAQLPETKPVDLAPVSAASTATAPSAKVKTENRRPFTEGKLLPDDTIGLLVAHPKQFFESPLGTMLTELGYQQRIPRFQQILEQTNLKPADIDRVVIAFDQQTVNGIARLNGLQVAAGDDGQQQAIENAAMKNKLKQIGLAFHNYHDVYAKFPRVDGDGEGVKTGLSWRVHLLPFLDQAPLYNRFKLDEPWDSEHNKALIGEMPELFKTSDVTEENKTAIQLFTGEKTMFHGDKGLGIRQVTDGTSNTILCVKAGADKAEVWTKPEGIVVDLTSPKAAFGKNDEKSTFVLLCDGSVRRLSLELDDTTLVNLIQPSDGNPVDFESPNEAVKVDVPQPTIILSMATDINLDGLRRLLLTEPQEETYGGQTYHANSNLAVWSIDPRTIVVGTNPAVQKAIDLHKGGESQQSNLANELHLNSQLTFTVDVQSQSSLVLQLLRVNPMLGMISNIKTLAGGLSVDGKPDDPLVEIAVRALDAQMAAGLAGMATLGVNQLRMSIQNQPLPPSANDSDKEMNGLIKKAAASAKVTTEEDTVRFRISIPEGFDRLPDLLKPTLEKQ